MISLSQLAQGPIGVDAPPPSRPSYANMNWDDAVTATQTPVAVSPTQQRPLPPNIPGIAPNLNQLKKPDANKPYPAPIQAAQDTLNNYKNAVPDFLKAAGSGKSQASTLGPDGKPIGDAGAFVQNVGQGALRATESGINTIFSPISNLVKHTADVASDNPELQKFANNPQVTKVLDFLGNSGNQYSSWAEKNPEQAKNLESAFVVALTAAGGAGGGEAEGGVPAEGETGAETPPVVETPPTTAETTPPVSGTPTTPTELSDYVDRIAKTHANVMADPEFTGNVSDGINTMKQDIVENFSKGFNADPKIVDEISSLKPEDYSSIDDFAKATKEVIDNNSPETELTPAQETPKNNQDLSDPNRASAWKDIQPKSNSSTKLAYANEGNVTEQGVFSKGKLLPSSADNDLLDEYQELYKDGTVSNDMSPQEKQTAINEKASELHDMQKGYLSANNKAVQLTNSTQTGLFDKLNDVANESSLPFTRDTTMKNAYDSAMDTFKEYLNTGADAGASNGATTLTDIDSAITKFDKTMSKFGGWDTDSTGALEDTAKARVMAIRDVHMTARNFIADQLPENSPWVDIRNSESNMYDLSDRVSQRIADTVGASKASLAMDKLPFVKKLGWRVVWPVAVGTIIGGSLYGVGNKIKQALSGGATGR